MSAASPQPEAVDFLAVGPSILLLISAVMALLVDALERNASSQRIAGHLCLAGILFATAVQAWVWGLEADVWAGFLRLDDFASFLNILYLSIAAVTIMLSFHRPTGGEFAPLVLFSVIGMMIFSAASDLLTVFLGLELLSIPLYVLAGYDRTRPESFEASLKYLLLGAFASGFFLFGIALVYGATGTTHLVDIGARVSAQARPELLAGLGLILVGFGFKVALAPFHAWVPDVYQGAPTPVAGLISTGSKAAAFGALLRLLDLAFEDFQTDWRPLLWGLAALTMLLGNLIALAQTEIKRLLGYSSIAHTGYALVGIVAANELGDRAVLLHLTAYIIMSLGAFGAVALLAAPEETLTLEAARGLARRRPGLAFALAVCLFSLAGVPPTAGFAGKFYLFTAAVRAGYTGLAVIGVVTSAISLYYYLVVTVRLYMDPLPAGARVGARCPRGGLAVGLCTALVLLVGIYPAPVLRVAAQAIASLP